VHLSITILRCDSGVILFDIFVMHELSPPLLLLSNSINAKYIFHIPCQVGDFGLAARHQKLSPRSAMMTPEKEKTPLKQGSFKQLFPSPAPPPPLVLSTSDSTNDKSSESNFPCSAALQTMHSLPRLEMKRRTTTKAKPIVPACASNSSNSDDAELEPKSARCV
jgi:hypothetical protein